MPESYHNILCVGDSHASTAFTRKPWPHWLDGNVDVLCSPGAGIEIGVQKLALQLSKKEYDLVIFQAPHNMRLSVGMNYDEANDNSGVEKTYPWQQHGNKVDDEFIMSLNPSNNVYAMKKFHGKDFGKIKIYKNFNEWFLRYQADNNYETTVKYITHLFTVEQLCKTYNTKLVTFLWHPIEGNKNDLYNSWSKHLTSVVPSTVTDWQESKGWKGKEGHCEHTVDGYHLDDIGSRTLVQEYLKPNLTY